MGSRVLPLVFLFAVAAAVASIFTYQYLVPRDRYVEPKSGPSTETYTVDVMEYHAPPPPPRDVLVDDRLEDMKPLPFDPLLVDRRPLSAMGSAWLMNASNAVLRLEVSLIKPDQDAALLKLHPSFADAAHGAPGGILPSVNAIDGKAKQFDDGLYAALDEAYYRGLNDRLRSHVSLIRRIYERAGRTSPAAPFLAAGLELADVHVPLQDTATKAALLRAFNDNEVASRPIGFYTWNKTLTACFRFLRFFQREFAAGELAVPQELARILRRDVALAADYRKAVEFYARLTNPYVCLTLADLPTDQPLDQPTLLRLCQQKHVNQLGVAVFPPSGSRENVLVDKLFPQGIPADVDLMQEFIRRIRSGEVRLEPRTDSGWYDYQVYALETMLVPEKGDEHHKLLLTRAYKKRMLEAFQALVTKRRETHARSLAMAGASAAPPSHIAPRLRLEPCPSYYLRTARAYSFLANFLEAALGQASLEQLHGLTEHGARPQNLYAELHGMRDLYYGLYLVCAEDIGLETALSKGELADPEKCYHLAADWLPKAYEDPDLAVDTRVAVPVRADPIQKITRLWLTLGVRLTRLEVSYARPPSLKPAQGTGTWTVVEPGRLEAARYLIPVDEFAEIEVPRLTVLTRKQLREACDRLQTKEAIVEALEH